MQIERIRPWIGLVASMSSCLQGIGLVLQFAHACQAGTDGLSFPFFIALSISTFFWCLYSLAQPKAVDWFILVPNGMLCFFGFGVCFLIIAETWF